MNIEMIVVNYKYFNETIKYVNELQKQQGVNLHIVIVDNASPNDSYDQLKLEFKDKANVTVVASLENGGYAKGNNFGIKTRSHSHDDLIIISNSDLVIDDIYLLDKWAHKHLALPDVAISSPIMYVGLEPSNYPAWKIPTYMDSLRSSIGILEKVFGDRKRYKFDTLEKELVVDCLPGSLFMLEYSVFEEMGFFDEGTFLYMEEVILARKAKELGYKNYLLPSLHYEHLVSKTISSVLPSRKMRKHLVDGSCYYHSKYDNIGIFKSSILRFNYYIWCVENLLISVFKGIVFKFRLLTKK